MTNNESGGALDSILKSVKKFEADFRRLATQLQVFRESSKSGEAAQTLESIRKCLLNIQREISKTLGYGSAEATISIPSPPMIIRCKHWEDFKSQASNAENLSFLCREEEKTFQVDAVKGSRVYTYSGQLPTTVTMLKTCLSKEMIVEESKIVEGVLAIG
jgi:hypothetical protein